jgi:hypothetical protein
MLDNVNAYPSANPERLFVGRNEKNIKSRAEYGSAKFEFKPPIMNPAYHSPHSTDPSTDLFNIKSKL